MGMHMSPFMVPMGAFAVAIVAIIASMIGEAHRQRLKAEQRLAMVARGMNADDIDKLLGKSSDGKKLRDPMQSLMNARRIAIVLISSGVGLALFFVTLTMVLHELDILSGAAIGVVPIAIGVGFLIDYKLQKRDLSRFGMELGHESE